MSLAISTTMDQPHSRRSLLQSKSTSRLGVSSRTLLNVSGHTARRRYPTKEITRLPSFKGNPMTKTARYPGLEEVGRLKSFRQASLRKLGSIRNLEMLRQGSFRQLGPGAFHEIANTSMNGSFVLSASVKLDSSCKLDSSFANASASVPESSESGEGPPSTIEFREGEGIKEDIEIEIAPGIYKRLKGSEETQRAWDNNRCVDAMCFVCDTILAVAPGCDSVICPHCRSISPVFKDDTETFSMGSNDSWWLTLDDGEAVGLGIAIPET